MNTSIKLVGRFKKKIDFLFQERMRVEKLKFYENQLKESGYEYIVGIDEVGRGSIAGPVIAVATHIRDIQSFFISELKDSKKLNRHKRDRIFNILKNKNIDYGVGIVDSKIIDRVNIRQATFLAMKRAVGQLKMKPNYILVDGFPIPNISVPQKFIIKGEDKSVSIATASIIAKAYRDHLMCEYHKKYPYYQFNKNAGYGTHNHYSAIHKFGICPLHRISFNGVLQK